MTDKDYVLRQILITIVTVFITWEFHEFSHWLAGVLLGNKMTMTLNTAYPTNRKYNEEWNSTIVDSAGPLVTLLQAILSYALIKKYAMRFLFPSLLTCLYMRTLAAALTVINPNDEARISKTFGLGPWLLPITMVGILFYLTFDIAKTKEITKRTILVTAFTILGTSSAIILLDQALKIKLL